MEKEATQNAQGLRDSYEKQKNRTIGEHLGDYLADLETARAFLNWLVRHKRIADNPLAAVGKLDTRGQAKRKRRALPINDLHNLLDVAEERRLVYWTAVQTGLRRSELADLRWDDRHIERSELAPFVALRAESTKAHRADVIPVRRDLADALRFTFNSMLGKAGVQPRTAMELMRHTDLALTMNGYTDPRLLDTAKAIESLPSLTPKKDSERQEVRRTGTDDSPLVEILVGANRISSQTSHLLT